MGLGLLMSASLVGAASAQPKPTGSTAAAANAAPFVGVTEVAKVTPSFGFIDDVVASDGTRLVYAVSDAGMRSELHVLTLADKTEAVINIAPVTAHPIALALVGTRAFIIGQTDDGKQNAALIELVGTKAKPPGTPVYKLTAQAHITLVDRDGKRVAAMHRQTSAGALTRHDIELVALDSGKRLAGGRIEVDAKGTSPKLDLKINHWTDGMTRAIGIKGGEWDKKENQRSPDVEAVYDVVTMKFVEQKPIADLFEQRKRFTTLAEGKGDNDFVRTTTESSGSSIQLWRGGKLTTVTLDQPLTNYDIKSAQAVFDATGAWLAVKMDPVNPDAVARKKADPEYLDVFRVELDGKAARKGRVLAKGVRHKFGVAGDKFWLLERSPSSDRGGKSLALYKYE